MEREVKICHEVPDSKIRFCMDVLFQMLMESVFRAGHIPQLGVFQRLGLFESKNVALIRA